MEFFTRHRIQHLPVAYDDKVLGIISVNDMLKFMADQLQNNPSDKPHEMLNEAFDLDKEMTPQAYIRITRHPLIDILEVLSDGKFQALPVVEGGEIKGDHHQQRYCQGLSLGPHPLNGKIEKESPGSVRGFLL